MLLLFLYRTHSFINADNPNRYTSPGTKLLAERIQRRRAQIQSLELNMNKSKLVLAEDMARCRHSAAALKAAQQEHDDAVEALRRTES